MADRSRAHFRATAIASTRKKKEGDVSPSTYFLLAYRNYCNATVIPAGDFLAISSFSALVSEE